MNPTIGRIVHVQLDKQTVDALAGQQHLDVPCAAVVVRVWGPDMINVRLLADGPPSEGEWLTSVVRRGSESDTTEDGARTWEWPPRES